MALDRGRYPPMGVAGGWLDSGGFSPMDSLGAVAEEADDDAACHDGGGEAGWPVVAEGAGAAA